MVEEGMAVGIIAAQSIGGTWYAAHDAYVPHRWLGVDDRYRQPIEVQKEGIVKLARDQGRQERRRPATSCSPATAKSLLLDTKGRELEKYEYPTVPFSRSKRTNTSKPVRSFASGTRTWCRFSPKWAESALRGHHRRRNDSVSTRRKRVVTCVGEISEHKARVSSAGGRTGCCKAPRARRLLSA